MPSQFLRHSPSLGENHIHSTILPSGISSRKLATALFGTQTGIFRQKHHIIPSHFRYSCIVGYAGSKLCDGFSIISPQFEDVAGGKFSISNFRPAGENLYGNVFVSRLDGFGRTLEAYGWTDCGGKNWDVSDVWVDSDNNIVTDIEFAPGEALWIQSSSANQVLQSSGQVSVKDATVQLCDGFTLGGNSFPIAIKINDILPTGENLYGNVFISVLDEYGRTLSAYGWTDCGGESWDIPNVWVDSNNNPLPNTVSVAPGRGLWIQGSSNSQFLTFPAPEF